MMGTTVWTTPTSVRFHINRRDLFSSDRNHAGSHRCPVDYRGGCARIEIDVGEPVFELNDGFRQHLSIYDAECTIISNDVSVRCFISSEHDILPIEIDDQRTQPREIRVTVSMWREPEVTTPLNLWNAKHWIDEEIETGTHTVRYKFSEPDNTILVKQEFEEIRFFRDEKFHSRSALAVSIPHEKGARIISHEPTWKPAALFWDEKPLGISRERDAIKTGTPEARSFVIAPMSGTQTVLVSSAASTALNQFSVDEKALNLLKTTSSKSYNLLRNQHTTWWHEFWSRTFVHMSSKDNFADYLERVRTLHLYYSAASSRNTGPVPQNAGLLFQTEGDIPHLGTQLWHWIVEMMYRPLIVADAMDVVEPYFDMYARQLPSCKKAAQQRWELKGGALFPETSPADGPTLLPDDCAGEFRNFFLGKTKSETLSTKTRVLCQHDSHLYYSSAFDDKKADEALQEQRPFASIAHIVSTGSKIALHAWWRFRCTGDKQWLRERAYPLLRETVELYRHLVKKKQDGLFHLKDTNVMESFYLVQDSLKDLAAIRGTTGPAIQAAKILGVDSDLQIKWKDMVKNLAPYPMGHELESKKLTFGCLADDVWSAGHLGPINIPGDDFPAEDIWVHPIETFEIWTLETADSEEDRIVQRLLDLCPNHLKVMTGRHWRPSLVRTPIAFPLVGRGEELPTALAAHYSVYKPQLVNGLSCFEQGIQSMGLEPSGMVTLTLHNGLMQSISPRPGDLEIIHVFPGWPKEWDASFSLLARGGFLISSSVRDGKVEFIEIESRLGEECRMRNPWDKPVQLTNIDGSDTDVEVSLLENNLYCFNTVVGAQYRMVPEGKNKPQIPAISPEPAEGPVCYSFDLPSGITVKGQIGRGKDEPERGLIAYETGNRRFRIEQRKIEQAAVED